MEEVHLIGNLGGDPETRYTKSGNMNVSFSLAVNKKFTDASGQQQSKTHWYRCTAWNKQAETLDKLAQNGWLTKGNQVFVRGDLDFSEWTTQNGESRYTVEVNVGRLQLCGGKRDDNQN